MISLLCPTRNRPDNIERLVNSVRDTAKDPDDIEFVFYVDDDDNSYADHQYEMPPNIQWVVGPRIVLSEMWNECYKKAKGDILMHCGDDLIFRSQHWDKLVRDTFKQYPDGILFAYGRDGSGHDGVFGTHGFVSRKWVETLGYFVPPYFSSDWNDTWLNDVAKMIGRHVHIDMLTEHMHYAFGKAAFDKTHQERVARGSRDNVDQLYIDKLPERKEDADKLKKVMSDV